MAREAGDVLAFLPGWGEIRRTAERLGGSTRTCCPCTAR
jgi:ATP-dependent helicase HrpB